MKGGIKGGTMNRWKFAWLILTDKTTRTLLADTIKFADTKSYLFGEGISSTIWFIARTFHGRPISIK